MGIERSKLTSILRAVTVDYFGDKVVVTYRPDVMTPRKSAELAQAQTQAEEAEGASDAEAQAGEQLAERLAEMLVHWDVTDDGEPVPPTKDNLMDFPNALLIHIATAIGEDQRPNVKTGRR